MLKSSLNPITTQNMANLQSTVTCLSIVVSSYSFCACCQHRDILKLLRLNSHSTSLRLKGRPICKILAHTSKSLFAASLVVLTIRATLWRPNKEMQTKPLYDSRDWQLAKQCHTLVNRRFQQELWCLLQSDILEL